MAEILLSSAELRQRASALRHDSRHFESGIRELEGKEQSLHSSWDGEAKSAFHRAVESDVRQMQEFAREIERYAQTLEEIAQEYERAEHQNLEVARRRTWK